MQKNSYVIWVGMIWLLAVCVPGAANTTEKLQLPTHDELLQTHQATADKVPEGLSLREWSQIQAQLRAARYHFRSAPEAGADSAPPITASNPRHRLTLSLDEAGATLSPDAGDWQLGLRTTGLGRAGQMEDVVYQAPSYKDARSDIAYASHPGATEWYVNGSEGIEHGWTLEQRPTGDGEVKITVAVDGFEVKKKTGGGLQFVSEGTYLNYTKLQVFDAQGRTLQARMKPTEMGLQLVFNDIGAAYPVTVDPLIQTAQLQANDGDTSDQFGNSVSVSGDTAIVGAYLDDDKGDGSGSAYVFVRDAEGVWSKQAKLLADDGAAGNQLGWSVAVDGDTVVLGAPLDSSFAGSAYVFVRDGANWSQQAKLLPDDSSSFNQFGTAVSVSGDTALIGKPGDGSQGTNSGSAYVFVRDEAGVWSQQEKLLAGGLMGGDGAGGDTFGKSLSLAGDTALIGVRGDDDKGFSSGSAYVFVRDEGGVWSQQQKLLASDGAEGDGFGDSVSVSGDTAVVGATGDASGASSGSAYVFVRDEGGVWSQQQKLLADDGEGGDEFGVSVSVSGDMALIGANGDQDKGTDSGSVYVFVRDGTGAWSQSQKLLSGDGGPGDEFGTSVSVSGSTAVVGAPLEDNPFGIDSGSSYVFEMPGADYGDAPASADSGFPGSYPVLQADDGARHTVGGLFMGLAIDEEADGQPNEFATGDDLNGDSNDEDGAVFTNLVVGSSNANLNVVTSQADTGVVNAWIDFDRSGSWEPGEQIVTNGSIAGTNQDFSFAIDEALTPGDTFARVRMSSMGGDAVTGPADDGEVIDQQVSLALPTLSINDVALTEGNSGQQNLTFTVTLSQAVSQDVTFDFATVDDSATIADNDYANTNGMATISGGDISTTINVPVNGDTKFEIDEAFNINLSNPSGATIDDGQGVGTINNDDSEPTVSLTVDNAAIPEAGGVTTLTATLSNASYQPVTVDLGFGGTATNGGDYNPSGNQIVIPANSLTGNITHTAVQDSTFEGNETIVTNVTGVTNGTENGEQQESVTINDDDPQPNVSLSLAGSPMVENGGVAIVAASLSNPSVQTVTVNLAFSGTASGGGTDYTASGSQIVIPAGSTSGQISLTGVDDSLDEANETVIVDIDSVTNGTENVEQQVTATINDDDAPPSVTLGSDVSDIAESGGVATLTATLSAESGLPVTVDLAFSGTATNGSDYNPSSNQIVIPAGSLSGNMSQTAVDDAVFESDENIITDIANVTNGTEDGTQQVTVAILDDDPAPMPDIAASSSELAFGSVQVGSTSSQDVTLSNTGDAPLDITGISIGGTNADQFSQSNDCTDTPLNPGEDCTVMTDFAPDSSGDKQASLDISSNDPDENPLTITLNGTAVPATNPIINAPASQDFGSIPLGDSSQRTLQVSNDGDGELVISSISLSGADAGLFAVTNDQCTGMVAPGGVCTIEMSYTPVSEGENTAQLDIDSNDAANPSVQVGLTGRGGDDNDGATPEEEDAVPNPTACNADGTATGDGNCDGIPDSEQDNVTSHPTHIGGGYVTVVSEDGTKLSNVGTDVQPDSGLNNFVFPIGFFGFQVGDLAPGSCTVVTVILDDSSGSPFGGSAADFYFKFGPTPDFPNNHFYRFDFDGETGAVPATVNGQDAIELHLCDGKRGDHDLDATNGSIEDPGGPAVEAEASEDDGGSSSDGGGSTGGTSSGDSGGSSSSGDDDEWYEISGCSLSDGRAPFDPMLLIMLVVSIGWLGRRMRVSSKMRR